MRQDRPIKKTVVSMVVASMLSAQMAGAGQLDLAQSPPGTVAKAPAPNVIVSVDDSGSMGNSGILSLQNALRETFGQNNVADGEIRLAFQSMTGCRGFSSANSSNYCGGGANAMRVFKGKDTDSATTSSRGAFFQFVDRLDDIGWTPSHQTFVTSEAYMSQRGLGIEDPWGSNPGVQEDKNPLACRRAYHIFMTDGVWNREYLVDRKYANADGKRYNLPDGVRYDPQSITSRVYADAFERGSGNASQSIPSLADMAFYAWSRDLRPDIPNEVRPSIKRAGDETFFMVGSPAVTVPQYWNPKNDPATWQHLTTYSIGFNDAADWGANGSGPVFNDSDPQYGSGMYGVDYVRLWLGTRSWLDEFDNERPGLWHMALNSRGRFIPARSADDLKNAFKDILDDIISANVEPISQARTAAGSVRTHGTLRFSAMYNSEGWTGAVKGEELKMGTAQVMEAAGWGQETTATRLDTRTDIDARLILSSKKDTTSTKGILFQWADGTDHFDTEQKNWLNKVSNGGVADNGTVTPQNGDGKGKLRVDFLRGKRGGELPSGTAGFRQRKSIHGDVVNSAIWYVGVPVADHAEASYKAFKATHKTRESMIYVGANDGMLHGFAATTGDEKMAYIPQGVYPHLSKLTDPGYTHRYYVDGSPVTGDIYDSAAWKTVLVGTLGAGGKGYFALDATNPSQFSKDSVLLDNSDGKHPDIGHIMNVPVVRQDAPLVSAQITKLNNGRWAWVSGNGYNSLNERPVLLIQYLDGDRKLLTIPAVTQGDEAKSNGLSAPNLYDLNGDRVPDVVYAGDLRGNLWKFNLIGVDDTKWGNDFGQQPLFTAKNGNDRQPITAPPALKPLIRPDVRGLMVAFGTGRNLTLNDSSDTSKQTLYSVLDKTGYKVTKTTEGKPVLERVADAANTVATVSLGDLVEQTLNSDPMTGSVAGREYRGLTNRKIDYTSKKGWWMHLGSSASDKGRRVLEQIQFYDNSSLMEVLSIIPARNSGANTVKETCEPKVNLAQGFRTMINITTGTASRIPLIDMNGDGKFNSTDLGVADMKTLATPEERYSKADRNCRGQDCYLTIPREPKSVTWSVSH